MASDADLRDALETEASRIGEDSLYSSRGHFQAAVIWARVHLWVGRNLSRSMRHEGDRVY